MKLPEEISFEIAFPENSLKDFVSHFWCSRWNNGIQNSIHYHSTANTNTELVFAFNPAKQPVFSTLQGHTANYCRIETGGISEMFGVSIYAHAIPYFFDASAGELVNQLVELKDMPGTDATAISQRLAYCINFDSRVDLISQYLKTKFHLPRKSDAAILNAIKKIRQFKGQVNIENLAKEHLMSQKQFERRFKNSSGFNPKLYSRIFRFENALWPYDDSSFTEKALNLGYFDQAHFINEFRQFSGFSPGKYAPITS